jgi:hypothetical protein
MKVFNIQWTVLLICLAFACIAIAESMAKSEYIFVQKNLNSEYNAAIVRCNALYNKTSFLECVEMARSNRSISETELLHAYKLAIHAKSDTTNTENRKKTRPSDSKSLGLDEELMQEYMDSAVIDLKPFKPNINPPGKDNFKDQQKLKTM